MSLFVKDDSSFRLLLDLCSLNMIVVDQLIYLHMNKLKFSDSRTKKRDTSNSNEEILISPVCML